MSKILNNTAVTTLGDEILIHTELCGVEREKIKTEKFRLKIIAMVKLTSQLCIDELLHTSMFFSISLHLHVFHWFFLSRTIHKQRLFQETFKYLMTSIQRMLFMDGPIIIMPPSSSRLCFCFLNLYY